MLSSAKSRGFQARLGCSFTLVAPASQCLSRQRPVRERGLGNGELRLTDDLLNNLTTWGNGYRRANNAAAHDGTSANHGVG